MYLPILLVLLAIACAVYVFLDLQLIRGLGRLKVSAKTGTQPSPFITVLIAARDEEHNLPRVLDALLAQDYPADKFHIVVVNDRSADGTEAVLQRYAGLNSGKVEYLNVEAVPHGLSPKKHALMKGLERSHGEWIAVTDADSIMGSGWLSALSREFRENTGMVLGMTICEEPGKGLGLASGVQALEFASHGIVSAALVGLGFPVNANANNLAYRRKAFEEAGAFQSHANVVSGDDDFVLQEIHATGRWAIRFCPDPGGATRTAPPDSWNHFWEQRKRWASKCVFYRPRPKAFLAGIFVFYAAIPALLLAGLWDLRLTWLGLGAFSVKTLADFAVMRRGLRSFGLAPLLRFFPATALLHIPLILAAVTAGNLRGFTWKGQRLSRRV